MARTWVSLILISLAWAVSAHAQTSAYLNKTRAKIDKTESKDSRFSAQWRLRLEGTDRKDEQSQEKSVQTRLELDSRYDLSPSVFVLLYPTVRFASGQTQSYDGADKMENKLLLGEASANYVPISSFSMSAGALNQRASHSSLLIDRLAFPAARIAAGPQEGSFKVFAFAESAIPTSTSLSTNTKELEPTPGLDTLGTQLQWSNGQNLKIKSLVGYFQYRNLPSAVAMDSQLLGNDVTKSSEASYKFNYDYAGFETAFDLTYLLTPRLRLLLSAEYLTNTQAPSELNSGYLAGAGFETVINSQTTVDFKASYYRVAPEAAVAYFNATAFETNRIGYKTETFLNFRKQNFRVGVRYNESEVIYTSNFQSREKTVTVLLETFYVDI